MDGKYLFINVDGWKTGRMLLLPHLHLRPASLLFLVLPLPCLTNSRYLNHARLEAILKSTGWEKTRQRDTAKLSFWLLQSRGLTAAQEIRDHSLGPEWAYWDGTFYKKEELRKGSSRNNFTIVIDPLTPRESRNTLARHPCHEEAEPKEQ